MTNLNQNFIAGEWLAGASEIPNINPSDLSDTIGNYAQADEAQLNRALDAAADRQIRLAGHDLARCGVTSRLISTCNQDACSCFGEPDSTLEPDASSPSSDDDGAVL